MLLYRLKAKRFIPVNFHRYFIESNFHFISPLLLPVDIHITFTTALTIAIIILTRIILITLTFWTIALYWFF